MRFATRSPSRRVSPDFLSNPSLYFSTRCLAVKTPCPGFHLASRTCPLSCPRTSPLTHRLSTAVCRCHVLDTAAEHRPRSGPLRMVISSSSYALATEGSTRAVRFVRRSLGGVRWHAAPRSRCVAAVCWEAVRVCRTGSLAPPAQAHLDTVSSRGRRPFCAGERAGFNMLCLSQNKFPAGPRICWNLQLDLASVGGRESGRRDPGSPRPGAERRPDGAES